MANEFRVKNGVITPNETITDTTVSTSTTTGALKVSGGAGIAGNLYATNFYGNGSGLTALTGANVTGIVPSATFAATVTTASQPNITSLGTLTSITSSGVANITNTTVATSKTTGALKVSGGAGIAGNVYAGAYYSDNGTVGFVKIDTASTSLLTLGKSTGPMITPPQINLIRSGGADYDIRLTVSGGSNTVAGQGTFRVEALNTELPSIISNGIANITNTTISTSTTTGALVVAGGAGIAGNVYASSYYGNGSTLTNLSGSNVVGSVATANNVTLAAQPNITSVGTLTSLTTSGQITSTVATGTAPLILSSNTLVANLNADLLDGFNASQTNLANTVVVRHANSTISCEALVANAISYAAQSNITQIGTLTTVANISNTTVSTSTTTGALKVSGGAGIAGNLYATKLFAENGTTGKVSIDTGTGSLITLGKDDGTTSTNTLIRFLSSGNLDHDVRLNAFGGSSTTAGQGTLQISANLISVSGKLAAITAAGVGASVTQLTSRTTGVTINAMCGQITLFSATTTAGQISTFTVTNSYVSAYDAIILTKRSGTGFYIIQPASVTNGSFTISVYTPNAVSSAEAPNISFYVIGGSIT